MTSSVETDRGADRPGLPGLQYLRGLAASGVVLVHISAMMDMEKYLGRRPFDGIFDHGAFGVDLFFALSGFIMVYIALQADLRPRVEAAGFLWSRFTRIAPFLWVVVVLFAALRWWSRGVFVAEDYLRAVTFWPVGQVAPTQAWTLRYELLFYLVFAGAFLVARPFRWVGAAWLATCAVLFPIGNGWALSGLARELAWFAFNPLNLLFGFGALAGWIYLRVRSSLFAPGWAALLILPLTVGVTAATRLVDYDRLALGPLVVVGSLLGALLIFAAALPASDHVAARIGKLIGDASYSIYLTHGIFLAAALGIVANAPSIPDAVVVAGIFVLCIVGGIAAHFAIERPVLAFARGRWKRNMKAGQTAGAGL